MRNTLVALYSALCYAIFLATFLYAIGFVTQLVVPKSIDSGAVRELLPSLLVDLALLGVFALQHSIMARPAFKRVWTRIVPADAERSTFVLAASLALILLFWQWRPLPQPVWSIETPWLALLLTGLGWAGWAMVLVSTFLISHFPTCSA